MSKRIVTITFMVIQVYSLFAKNKDVAKTQNSKDSKDKTIWINKQFKKLSKNEKIAQLFIIRAHSNWDSNKMNQVKHYITKYNVGGICFFQGDAYKQALITNNFQKITKTPLFISIDAEWGLGMRLSDVVPFPRNMLLGAIQNNQLIYDVGKAIGKQCKRLGIQINFAPSVDINNNPLNPVINDRSFGEDANSVTQKARFWMNGLQSQQVLACLKHFPGHGDVDVDSHLDLPQILKNKNQFLQNELVPYKNLINQNTKMIMVAHLFVPAIDSTPKTPSSLSYSTITKLLKNELHYSGLIVTDALEMKAIQNYFPDSKAVVEALKAGNDLICLPTDIEQAILMVKKSIKNKELSWKDIDNKVKRVLEAKYNTGLNNLKPIDTNNLLADLNQDVLKLNPILYQEATTLLNQKPSFIPFDNNQKYLLLSIGLTNTNHLNVTNQPNVFILETPLQLDTTLQKFILNNASQFNHIIVAIGGFNRKPLNNFEIPAQTIGFINNFAKPNNILMCFGNPYALQNFKKFQHSLILYEDNLFAELTGLNWLFGKFEAQGKIPVTIP
ncbi:MAG: glycoside hydrolase family 3 N-terminal domain-containing protein [Alphaproteobacteria bacterium]|nr:glycoside hydrolase family 3 N-terminal domain-containing protein [Alphaproteobacteria bacterium]